MQNRCFIEKYFNSLGPRSSRSANEAAGAVAAFCFKNPMRGGCASWTAEDALSAFSQDARNGDALEIARRLGTNCTGSRGVYAEKERSKGEGFGLFLGTS